MFKIQVIKVYDCSNNDKVYSFLIYLSLFDVYFGLLWGVLLYIVATNDTNNNNNNKNWRRIQWACVSSVSLHECIQGGFWELCFLFFFLHLVFLLWFILLGLLGSFQSRLLSI
jgi:hypothetical protein